MTAEEITITLLGLGLLCAVGYIWYLRDQNEQMKGGITRLNREARDR